MSEMNVKCEYKCRESTWLCYNCKLQCPDCDCSDNWKNDKRKVFFQITTTTIGFCLLFIAVIEFISTSAYLHIFTNLPKEQSCCGLIEQKSLTDSFGAKCQEKNIIDSKLEFYTNNNNVRLCQINNIVCDIYHQNKTLESCLSRGGYDINKVCSIESLQKENRVAFDALTFLVLGLIIMFFTAGCGFCDIFRCFEDSDCCGYWITIVILKSIDLSIWLFMLYAIKTEVEHVADNGYVTNILRENDEIQNYVQKNCINVDTVFEWIWSNAEINGPDWLFDPAFNNFGWFTVALSATDFLLSFIGVCMKCRKKEGGCAECCCGPCVSDKKGKENKEKEINEPKEQQSHDIENKEHEPEVVELTTKTN